MSQLEEVSRCVDSGSPTSPRLATRRRLCGISRHCRRIARDPSHRPCLTGHMDAHDWDERYAASDLVWSAEPNRFVAEELADLPPGRALDLAAGEGRNAIWLARRGLGRHRRRLLAGRAGQGPAAGRRHRGPVGARRRDAVGRAGVVRPGGAGLPAAAGGRAAGGRAGGVRLAEVGRHAARGRARLAEPRPTAPVGRRTRASCTRPRTCWPTSPARSSTPSARDGWSGRSATRPPWTRWCAWSGARERQCR